MALLDAPSFAFFFFFAALPPTLAFCFPFFRSPGPGPEEDAMFSSSFSYLGVDFDGGTIHESRSRPSGIGTLILVGSGRELDEESAAAPNDTG